MYQHTCPYQIFFNFFSVQLKELDEWRHSQCPREKKRCKEASKREVINSHNTGNSVKYNEENSSGGGWCVPYHFIRNHQKLRCVCFRGRPCNQTCQNSEAVTFFLSFLTQHTRESEWVSLAFFLLWSTPHTARHSIDGVQTYRLRFQTSSQFLSLPSIQL